MTTRDAALAPLVEALLDEPGLRMSPRLAAALEQAQDTLRVSKRGPCAICNKPLSDPEDYFQHATGEAVHMTCYDRMWEQ